MRQGPVLQDRMVQNSHRLRPSQGLATGLTKVESGPPCQQSLVPVSPPFLLCVDPFQLQQLLLCKCANTTKCLTTCASVLAFSQIFFKGLVTQFTTPLDPSNDAKLDHSSDTR